MKKPFNTKPLGVEVVDLAAPRLCLQPCPTLIAFALGLLAAHPVCELPPGHVTAGVEPARHRSTIGFGDGIDLEIYWPV